MPHVLTVKRAKIMQYLEARSVEIVKLAPTKLPLARQNVWPVVLENIRTSLALLPMSACVMLDTLDPMVSLSVLHALLGIIKQT